MDKNTDKAANTADVIVVGAGLAGLTAAEQLSTAGYDVIVLEGRDRVGGRVLTTSVAGVEVDAGATWVGPHHTAVRSLLERLGCKLIPQFHTGKGLISFGGHCRIESATALAPWVTVDIARVLGDLQKIADDLPMKRPWEHPQAARLDALSLSDWLDEKWALKDTRKFLTMFSLVHWGAPPADVSLFNVVRYVKTLGGVDVMMKVEGGDQQDRIAGTTQAFVKMLADRSGSRVEVNSPVRSIRTVENRVQVETATQLFEGRIAVVTAAPNHRSLIAFDPPLPEQHYGLSRNWTLGALSKAFVAFDKPFWRQKGLSGEAVSDHEAVFLTFDVSPSAEGLGVLMVFCDARGFDGYDVPARRSRVIDHIEHLFGSEARHFIDYTDFSWGNDSFAPGGPNPAVRTGGWTSFGRFLREPVGLVHWAGTETADDSSGTMNGAILSGQRVADEVAALLREQGPLAI